MTAVEFVRKINAYRSAYGRDEFVKWALGIPAVQTMINEVFTRTEKHGKAVGLLAKRKQPVKTDLSEYDRMWLAFFSEHEFNSMQEQRMIADLGSLITGKPLTKFMKVMATIKYKFPPYICIVPNGINDNGHHYKAGVTIMSMFTGMTFYQNDGTSGDHMTVNTEAYRLATKDEIAFFIATVLYASKSFPADLYAKLVGKTEANEEEDHPGHPVVPVDLEEWLDTDEPVHDDDDDDEDEDD